MTSQSDLDNRKNGANESKSSTKLSHPKRRRFLKAAGLAATSTIAGCTGGGDDDSGSSGDNSNSNGAATEGDTTKTASSSPESFENEAGVKVGANWETVKDFAGDEEAVTFYTTTDNEAVNGWIDGVQEKHPFLDVNIITGDGADLLSRWTSEYQTNNVNADLFESSSYTQRIWQNDQNMKLSGDFMPSFVEAPGKFKGSNGDWLATVQYLGSIFYNTDMVSEDDAESWMDIVTDDQWADRSLGWDPTPNMYMMTWFLEQEGKEFFENLNKQSPQFTDSHIDLARLCGAGEYPAAFTYTHKMGRFGDEMPLDYFKFDPHVSTLKTTAINNKSKNPNATLVFMNWLASKEGQTRIGEGEYIPWHPEAKYQGWPSAYPNENYSVKVVDPEADLERTRKVWKETMEGVS